MSKIFVFLFLLVAIFSNQIMAVEDNKEKVRVLAIDGGGMRGILPAVILKQLEADLKKRDPNARIAEYFDVVAGTSTGGIITGILTAPDPKNKHRPLYSADDVIKFYREHGPSIFTEVCKDGFFCPKFNGPYLHEIVKKTLHGTLVSETTTNVVISAFDVKLLQPTIFSSFKIKDVPYLNVKLSDACIGTSAAPTEFPPHYFTDNNAEFNLVDGLFVASMPARVAISEVLRQEEYKNKEIIMLSIGTGNVTSPESFSANKIWTAGDWTRKNVITMMIAAGATMNEYYINSTFKHQPQNYLRIQEYNLDPNMSAEDASQTNMDKLEEVGNNLLKQQVKRFNVDTFVPEETGEGTNEQALDKLAQILYDEKVRRQGIFPLSATY